MSCSSTRMRNNYELIRFRSFFALLKPNLEKHCNNVPDITENHSVISFVSLKIKQMYNCRSHIHLNSCQIFSPAPADYDVG